MRSPSLASPLDIATGEWADAPRAALRLLVVALAGFLVLTAAVLVWRRLAGALAQPLGPGVLVLVGAALSAAAAAARLLVRGVFPAPRGALCPWTDTLGGRARRRRP